METEHMPSDRVVRATGIRAGRTTKGNFVVDLTHGPHDQRLIVELSHHLAVDMAVQTVACLLCKSVDESPTIYDSRIRKAIRRLGVNVSSNPP